MLASNETDPNQRYGYIVAIGGAEDKTSEREILKRVLALTPEGNREVAVLATASRVPDEVFPAYEDAFRQIGASAVHRIDVRERAQANDPVYLDRIEQCGAIFFSGGDQARLASILGGSDLLQAIRRRNTEGAVVAGTSAGAAAMSATMIYDGLAADALRKGAVKMAAGLSFVEGVVIDSHFLERGRFTRLMEVGAANPQYVGIGLGEDAGVVIHPGDLVEAIGPGHVIIVDSTEIRHTNVLDVTDGDPVAVENVVMHALVSGCGFDIRNRQFLEAEDVQKKLKVGP